MSKVLVVIVVVLLAVAIALGLIMFVDSLDTVADEFNGQTFCQDITPVVVESSCVEDLKQYEHEVQARINTAVLLERARWVGQIETAIGTMQVFEDGSWVAPDGNTGCISYTLCDPEHDNLWYPADLFWPPPE